MGMRTPQSCDYCKKMVTEAGFVLGLIVLHVGCLGPHINWLSSEVDVARAESIRLRDQLNQATKLTMGERNSWGTTTWYLGVNSSSDPTTTAVNSFYPNTKSANPAWSTGGTSIKVWPITGTASSPITFFNTGPVAPESDLGP